MFSDMGSWIMSLYAVGGSASHLRDESMERLTLGLELDSPLPVLARLSQDKAHDSAASTVAAVAIAGTGATSVLARPGAPNEHAAFDGRVSREHAEEQANRRDLV